MQALIWNNYGMIIESRRNNRTYPVINIPRHVRNMRYDMNYDMRYDMNKNIFNKTSIFQIPNIGYKYNSYISNTKRRNEINKAQACIWLGFDIILEPFNKYNKYRRAEFPSGWRYLIDSLDRDKRRHGWFINENNEIIAELFVDDNESSKDIYIRIKFLKCIALI